MSPLSGTSPNRRSAFLQQLLLRLLDDPHPERRLPLRTRELDDPSIALLDAWATTADVIAFYTDRIAAEGFLDTAVEDSSVLALAALLGTKPRPGVAASVRLAYTLIADPADTAVLLAQGLLAQTVPGPGEQPQTYETVRELTARPSWNILRPRATQWVTAADLSAETATLAIRGTSARLKPRDVLLVDSGTDAPRVLQVRSVAPDGNAGRTLLTVAQPSTRTTRFTPQPAKAQTPSNVTEMVDALVGTLSKRPARQPASPVQPPAESFGASSDAVPRLIATLHPELADSLYSAIATSPTEPNAVPTVSTMRAVAAPLGARAAQRVVFDERGQPIGSEDWPLGGEHVVTATLTASSLADILGQRATDRMTAALRARLTHGDRREAQDSGIAQVSAGNSDASFINRGANVGSLSAVVFDQDAGLQISTGKNANSLSFAYNNPELESANFHIDAQLDTDSGLVTFTGAGGATSAWDPGVDTDMHGQFGPAHHLDIRWSPDGSAVTARVRTALPLAEPKVLHLDARYDEIVAGTPVLITGNAVPADDGVPGLLTTVVDATTVSTSQYGLTAQVTRLQLERPWIGEQRSLADVRDVAVYAQSDPLPLAPVPLSAAVSGQRIELDGLHAGLESGREILAAGARIDLPGTAVVPTGEVAVVAAVEVVVDPAPGGTPYTALDLVEPLAYAYRRDSVQIFGNVVEAHHAATRTEVLGGGRPNVPRQTFVLSTGPTLSDPTGAGVTTSLSVWVDGLRYGEVERIDAATPPTSYVTGLDPAGKTTVSFAAPLPAGDANVVAIYRSGVGAAGNARPHQISQLLSRPLAVSAVDNPLAASGGADPDGPDALRARIPIGMGSLGRAVSLTDYADLAQSWPGVGRAVAAQVSDGRSTVVHVSVSSSTSSPLLADSALIGALKDQLTAADPVQHVVVSPVQLLVIAARITIVHEASRSWDSVSSAVRKQLLAVFGYEHRSPGESVYVSWLVQAAHRAAGVVSCAVTGLTLVSSETTATELTGLPAALAPPVPPVIAVDSGDRSVELGSDLAPAQLAYLSDALPDLLILEGRTQ